MTQSHVYLDTSALVRRAELGVAHPSTRAVHSGSPVASLLQNPPSLISTAEVGLLEVHDVLTRFWRDTDAAKAEFDEAWITAAISLVMSDIASGRLAIRTSPPRAFEQAMTLVTMAARTSGRKLGIWDAVHLVTATAWAVDLAKPIELWTTDDDFEGFVALFPEFSAYVSVRHLDA